MSLSVTCQVLTVSRNANPETQIQPSMSSAVDSDRKSKSSGLLNDIYPRHCPKLLAERHPASRSLGPSSTAAKDTLGSSRCVLRRTAASPSGLVRRTHASAFSGSSAYWYCAVCFDNSELGPPCGAAQVSVNHQGPLHEPVASDKLRVESLPSTFCFCVVSGLSTTGIFYPHIHQRPRPTSILAILVLQELNSVLCGSPPVLHGASRHASSSISSGLQASSCSPSRIR